MPTPAGEVNVGDGSARGNLLYVLLRFENGHWDRASCLLLVLGDLIAGPDRAWSGTMDDAVEASAQRVRGAALFGADMRLARSSGRLPGVCEVTPATERSCATNHTAEAVRGSG